MKAEATISEERVVTTAKGRDLRTWIDEVEKLGELARINGADWDVEIGAITELGHHRGEKSKAILFDQIKGYPEGYRVLSNTLNTVKRIATTLHMDTNYTRLDFVKDIKRHITEVNYIKPEVVKDGPVMENVFEGKDIDMWKFPTPKWHELDGGRYIGTGSIDITVEPDEGWVNLGTYRVMIQNEDTLGFYISPGKQGRIMREKYFARGQSCKVAVSFGQDPLLYLAGGIEVPRSRARNHWRIYRSADSRDCGNRRRMRSDRRRRDGRRTVRRMDGILRQLDATRADHESEAAVSSKQSDHSRCAANATAMRI